MQHTKKEQEKMLSKAWCFASSFCHNSSSKAYATEEST
jgi:hypothetical protein